MENADLVDATCSALWSMSMEGEKERLANFLPDETKG